MHIKAESCFASRPPSFQFSSFLLLLCGSSTPQADVQHFTANATFVSEFKKKKKKTPCVFVRLGGIVLLLFVEIPVCREHLGVQWSPEAAAARALDVNLPTAACFLLIIQLLDVVASAGEMRNIRSFSDICHGNSSNFLKDVAAP